MTGGRLSRCRRTGAGRPPRQSRPSRPSAALLLAAVTLAGALAGARDAPAQQPAAAGGDSLSLAALQRAAERLDPRAGQHDALAAQSALRLHDLRSERMPVLSGSARAQYQSDVVRLPLALPGTAGPPAAPHDTYDASIAAQLRLYDPSLDPRRALERARLAESEARLETTLHTVRQAVNDAYFAALRATAQRAETEAALADLQARLEQARRQLGERAILPSAVDALEAELLRRRQSIAELEAARAAALSVLADLTGRAIGPGDPLPLPRLAEAVASVTELPRRRPEYARFARAREALDRQGDVLAARERPRLSIVGRTGYGRPGLDVLGSDFTAYWVAGLQLDWSPWSWGVTDREREALAIQQQIVLSDEEAFTAGLRRSVATDVAAMRRLEEALADDDRIVALRERILAETRLRYDEGVVTSAEYVDREAELLAARLARATHRVQLAESRARYLTTLGVELPR